MTTLHVTNGDIAAEGLAQAELGGSVLAWQDVLHDGPVQATATDADFAALRAAFISGRGWGDEQEVKRAFAARDARLMSAIADEQIVLWFEPDLYDQLQLCQVLSRMERAGIDAGCVSIVPADVMLGGLSSDRFHQLHAQRRRVGASDLRHATETWAAITAPEPTALAEHVSELIARERPGGYASNAEATLPYLGGALRRWLEELPSVDNGLGRTENQLCRVLETGACTMAEAYRRAHHEQESWVWLGDWGFASYVHRLAGGTHPLVELSDGRPLTIDCIPPLSPDMSRVSIRLTNTGYEVAEHRLDAIDATGIDRWFGGVHLTTHAHWRWNAAHSAVVRVVAT